MPQVAIVNKSTVVSDTYGQTITSALNLLTPKFCSDWDLALTTCVYIPKGKTTTIPLKIFLMDTSDEQNAHAYHDEINDLPYGKAFASTVLSNGGVMLYSSNPAIPTVAQAVCHELFEMLIDPNCNMWAMLADGETIYAYEVCDPVQSNSVTVQVQTGTTASKHFFKNKYTPIYTKVGLSDWVLPKWFDPQATKGPFNHNNTLTAPLTLDKNGYVVSLSGGTSNPIFGESVSTEKQEQIKAKLRVTRRANKFQTTQLV